MPSTASCHLLYMNAAGWYADTLGRMPLLHRMGNRMLCIIMPRTNCIELCIIMHAWHPPGTIVRASRTQTGQPEHGQAQKLATLAQFWAIPFIISGLHCQLILGVVFRVELTENITRLCSRFSIIRLANGVRIERRVESKHLKLWRCKLSSR